jgi:hypothetical protein
MELNFDKEIDALLRQTARSGEFVSTANLAHLDADEISAFAENALPERTRQTYTTHLAECARCRKILSNLISLNSEAEIATAASSAVSEERVESSIPWYRRIFAFPQIAFSMGALVLLFSGFFAYLVLQSLSFSNDVASSMPEMSEEKRTAKSASSEGGAYPGETYSANANANTAIVPSTSNATATNTSANRANTASTANTSAPVLGEKPRTEAPERDLAADAENQVDDALNRQKPQPTIAATPSVADIIVSGNAAKTDKNEVAKEEQKAIQQRREDNKKRGITLDSPGPPPNMAKQKSAPKDNRDATRVVGGKTFRHVGGIWFDSAYGTQPQISVRRGSDAYRRLDSGLRSIADSLGGTVVVVWKSKAYRIQ